MWLHGSGHQTNYPILTGAIEEIRKAFSVEKFSRLLTMADFNEVFNLFQVYSKEDNGPIKALWKTYLERVSLLLNLIRATREGNWSLHLECIKEMLP